MPVVYLNIGSNLGSREYFLNKAIELISDKFGYYCKSGVMESEPWGFDSGHRFLNVGVSVKTEMGPEEVLEAVKRIESEISRIGHRDGVGNYTDREVDIDIMTIDEILYSSDNLSLPHRHLKEREFFLRPLKELNPEWTDPVTGFPVTLLLKNVEEKAQ